MDDKVRIVRYLPLNIRKNIPDTKDVAMLQWSMRGIYPRITVYTSTNNAFKDKKLDYNFIITAPFDIITLEMLIIKLEELLEANNNTRYVIDCLNNKIENGERKDELITQAKVVVGKDDQGLMYISVLEEGKKKIKFELLANMKYFKYYNSNNELIKDTAELSKLYVKSYIKTLREFMYNDIIKVAVVTVEVNKPGTRNKPKEQPEVKPAAIDIDMNDIL